VPAAATTGWWSPTIETSYGRGPPPLLRSGYTATTRGSEVPTFKTSFSEKKGHFPISTDTNYFINQTYFLVLVIVALLETKKKTNMGSEYPTVGQLFHMQYPSYFF